MGKAYSASVRRDGRWWLVDVPELDVTGQARNLSEVEDVAREVIGLALDLDDVDDIAVSFDIELPKKVAELWEKANTEETRGRELVAHSGRVRADAIRAFRGLGINQADIARALHLSPQRISQLARIEVPKVENLKVDPLLLMGQIFAGGDHVDSPRHLDA